ncbi:MAG: hypothetical protein ACKVP7_16950 [Hyphomicrobiaceae bacterium]
MLTHHDLEGMELPRVLELLEKGKVGHTAVMDYLNIDSLNRLVEIMHDNGRQMPGHRPMAIRQETLDLLKQITRPLPKQAVE